MDNNFNSNNQFEPEKPFTEKPTEPQPVFYKYNCLLTNARRITTKKDMRQARFSWAFARG